MTNKDFLDSAINQLKLLIADIKEHNYGLAAEKAETAIKLIKRLDK